MHRTSFIAAVGIVAWPLWTSLSIEAAAAAAVDFNREIRPLLNEHCLVCHGGVSKKGGFSMLFEEEAFAPTASGKPAIRPGKPEASEIIRRLTTADEEDRMPADGEPLPAAAIEKIRTWIAQGAAWDKHWAYQPIPEPDPVLGIDTHIRQRLRGAGLEMSPPAPPEIQLRRLSLGLTGLPPTLDHIRSFLAQNPDEAYAEAVDRFLASPRFGERWAAMWLDLARYADTQGYEKDNPRQIWAYRDWVIRAFNQDMPFDQFTVEQLAGDLLPNPTTAQRVATGFHRNTMTNTEGGTDDEEFRVAAVIDRVNTTWEVWMGTSFGCVQCHSHPYDPFRHEDYYQFMAYFNNTADADRGDDAPRLEVFSEEQKARRQQIEARIAALERQLDQWNRELEEAFQDWQDRLRNMDKPQWTALRPVDARAEGEVTLEYQPDGSILATGPNPEVNTYTLTFDWVGDPITGFRLEVLPHESLKNNGPGRAPNGNLVVTELEVHAGEDSVPLRQATASYAQESGGHLTPYGVWDAEGVIDQDQFDPKAGWAIGGAEGKVNHLTVETDQALQTRTFKVVIRQNHGNRGHTLGRFRLLATASPPPLRSDEKALRPLLGVLDKPADQRTDEEKRMLREQFRKETPLLQSTRMERIALRQAHNKIRGHTTLVMQALPEGKRRETHVFERGNWMTHGKKVEPALPEIFGPYSGDGPDDRLELARWMVSDRNPLTARVMVNRFWEQLFGVGLVETLEDFGSQGDPPVNQPLLDELAWRFRHEFDWSVKRLLRAVVLSRAYRQSSEVTARTLELDPYNRLLARGPRFRIPAEMVRDQALAAAGLLSDKMYGPSVMPYQPEGVWQVVYSGQSWKTSPGDDRHRRALYTYWRRTSPYPSMMAFDAPSREFCTNRRIRTNTPLAALVTLNDPVYMEAAQGLARRMIKEGGRDAASRIRHGFRLLRTRMPTSAELRRLLKFHTQAETHFQEHPEAATEVAENREAASWTMVANVLLNLDGTVTLE